ncbi:hypothetical protein, partial [Agrobacterium vitis]|uniref:hypothetical protein n=1 Tax=Agrobacterium vitis TaxID=373 RepID=UPI001AEDEED8
FWSPSGISRQPRPKNDTTPYWTRQPWPHNLNQTVSGKAGAVQFSLFWACVFSRLGLKGYEPQHQLIPAGDNT